MDTLNYLLGLSLEQERIVKKLSMCADIDEAYAAMMLAKVCNTHAVSFYSHRAFNLALNQISADKLARFKDQHDENEFWHQWMGDK